MRRIPYGRDGGNAFDNLVTATEVQIARADGRELLSPAHLPRNFRDLDKAFRFLIDYAGGVGIAPKDAAYFVDRLLLLLTSCEERRFAEFENQSWWQFSGAAARGGAYAKYLADGLTRTLVAARAREMSARTGGYILLQLLFDLADPTGQVDRVLNGPTSEVWIDPWREHLEGMGVDFRTEHQVQAIHCRGGRVAGVTVVAGGRPSRHQADWYIAALPVEVMRLLASEQLVLADPRLARLHRLRTRWMNGIVYYLDRDVRAVHGHTVYIDSPWALTSISQPQFWQPRFQPERLGDGRARGILSVDASDWEAIGSGIRKQAMYCSREEIERRGVASAQGEPRRRRHARARAGQGARLVPRPEHRASEPDRGGEPRAAAREHGGLLARPAGRPDRGGQPASCVRLRAHAHRPGDDGGGERGRPAGRERDPRTLGLGRRAMRGLAAPRAGAVRARAGARPDPVQARPPAAAAAADGRRPRARGALSAAGGEVDRVLGSQAR